MPKILFTLEASSPAEAKAMMERAYGEVPITDDDIRDYLVRKGWWKPGVDNGPQRSAQNKQEPPVQEKPADPPPARKNTSPGASDISKIGSNTKTGLLAMLKIGKQPPAKFDQHMRLLWDRGEVKFDGEEYYL